MVKALLASLVACQLTLVACDTRDDIYKISGIKYSDNLLIQGFNTIWDDGAFTVSFGHSFADVVQSAEDCVSAILAAVVSDTFPDGTAITDKSWFINPGYDGSYPNVPYIFWPSSNTQAAQSWSQIKSRINGVEYHFDYSDQSVECIGKFMQVQAVSATLYSERFPSRPDMSMSTFWFNPDIVQRWMQRCVQIVPRCAFRVLAHSQYSYVQCCTDSLSCEHVYRFPLSLLFSHLLSLMPACPISTLACNYIELAIRSKYSIALVGYANSSD
jgi:hypothetical protein